MDVTELKPHQKRVVAEHDELDERLEKLHVFILDNPLFSELAKDEQRDLVDQRAYMSVYRDVLRRRIDRF